MLKLPEKHSVLRQMINFENLLSLKIPKVCALVTASMILPALAYADHDSGKWSKGDKGRTPMEQHDTDKGLDKGIPAVPETNAGWVLVPFFGAALLFSARELFRPRAAQK